MVFMGRGFTSGGQELGSAFSAAVCKIRARKCYIGSSPSVSKVKRSCFFHGKRSAVQLCLDHVFDICKTMSFQTIFISNCFFQLSKKKSMQEIRNK